MSEEDLRPLSLGKDALRKLGLCLKDRLVEDRSGYLIRILAERQTVAVCLNSACIERVKWYFVIIGLRE